MPALLLRPGFKRTALVSLSAAGATGLSYVYTAPDTKETLQVQLNVQIAVIAEGLATGMTCLACRGQLCTLLEEHHR